MKTLMFIACTACSLYSCKKPEMKDEQPKSVKTVKAVESTKEMTRHYTFISKPYRLTELSFRVGGPVNTFDVQNGQFFRKGELIASVDDRDYIIRQKRTATTLRQAESEYRRISALFEKGNISATRVHANLLLKNGADICDKEYRTRLENALAMNKPLSEGCYLKEQLREKLMQSDRKEALFLLDWVNYIRESKEPQLMKMASTVMAYRTGILAWYD